MTNDQTVNWRLNERALAYLNAEAQNLRDAGVVWHAVDGGGTLVDFGVETTGSLRAGLALVRICTANLAEIQIVPGELEGTSLPQLSVTIDAPVEACLFSQYAGWKLSLEQFFAMGSGPMRAAYGHEKIFQEHAYQETPGAVVGVLEGRQFPGPGVFQLIAGKTGVKPADVTLCIAPTASLAGNLQVVARVVETALHKLHDLKFDLSRIVSATGVVPLSPVAKNDLRGIGRTNDAILYGGRVTFWVRGDDESLGEVGANVPSCNSEAYGKPFLEIYEAVNRDFYKIDPKLFSPAELVWQNLETGHVQVFGKPRTDILRASFGM